MPRARIFSLSTGPLLLFPGLLTLINAPFDRASLGLTRVLPRRGLERGCWWPLVHAPGDAVAAGLIIIVLVIVTVIAVQAFDTRAAPCGGAKARVLPLQALFDGIEADPWAARNTAGSTPCRCPPCYRAWPI